MAVPTRDSDQLGQNDKRFFFTSESVSEGHPDKIADQISDAILDELLEHDPNARVACETLVKTGLVVIAGEISIHPEAKAKAKKFSVLAREVVKEIGYSDPDLGFDYRNFGVVEVIDEQSKDIARGVNEIQSQNKELGAGDQGLMFGYAVRETPQLMPASLHYSHEILKKLSAYRKSQKVDFLGPDAKSQVTVEYQNGMLSRVDTVVVSTMHREHVSLQDLEKFVIESVVKDVVPSSLIDDKTRYLINPTGRFVIGGPQGDCGLTGRKIIVDTYGGHGAHGGGAFSGKDPTKVDRSAAYLARYIAKNVVAAELADKVLIQIAYAIGVAEPVSIGIQTFSTEKASKSRILQAIRHIFKMKPREIIEQFELQYPRKAGFSYRQTASYGHFGRTEFPWEKLDKVEQLKDYVLS